MIAFAVLLLSAAVAGLLGHRLGKAAASATSVDTSPVSADTASLAGPVSPPLLDGIATPIATVPSSYSARWVNEWHHASVVEWDLMLTDDMGNRPDARQSFCWPEGAVPDLAVVAQDTIARIVQDQDDGAQQARLTEAVMTVALAYVDPVVTALNDAALAMATALTQDPALAQQIAAGTVSVGADAITQVLTQVSEQAAQQMAG